MLSKELERGILFSTALMLLNLVVGFFAALIAPSVLASTVATGAAFLELGLLLIIGGCLMSRQPIQNKDRYTEDGSITRQWRIALIGKQMLATAAFLFLYSAILTTATVFSIF
jgi:hypothetical protein